MALFFAIYSCELSVRFGECQPVTVALNCILFLRSADTAAPHDNDDVFIVFSVSIEFVIAKNEDQIERATNKSIGDRLMSPVNARASIVRRLHLHLKSSDSTPF